MTTPGVSGGEEGWPIHWYLSRMAKCDVWNTMTKCVKPLRHLATNSTKQSKWSVLIGRAGTK